MSVADSTRTGENRCLLPIRQGWEITDVSGHVLNGSLAGAV